MICRVCGRQLRALTAAGRWVWIHANGRAPEDWHRVDPVRADEA